MLGGSGERVQDALDRTPLSLKLGDDVGLAIAAVNDHGKSVFLGQGQMAVKPLLLVGKRGMVPVAVQARFTDGDHPGCGREFDDA